MDVKMKALPKEGFTPRELVITIESELELTVLRRLASTNVSVPSAVFGKGGYWAVSEGKSEKYEILYDFLGQLHKQIRELKLVK